ncbi:hypothetical protein DL546_009551 [Coniochaeta pulveracea]|uniref:Uncharacterized protein n=1 Tax=Coniochaeta pulveracea TaxID=177199 RepID=A0A420YLL9_9PEZI|nr:hypothetical protein DL546_009551 [Coniochaeta pulveracea]
MSVSSRSSSSSSNSSWSSKGSRTSSKWTSSSTKTRERKLPNTAAVNSLVWFSGRDPRKVKGVRVYETLWERDYYDDSRSTRSSWSTGTQTKKEYEIYFVESPYVRADWYSNSNGSTSRGWKTSSNSSSGRSSGQSRRNQPVDPWAGRSRAPQPHHHPMDDDDSSSEGSDDSYGHEYGMPVPGPPPMMGGAMGGMPPGMGMGPPGTGAFRPPGPPGGPPGGFRGPMGGQSGPPPPPPPPPPPSGPPGGGEPEFFKLN